MSKGERCCFKAHANTFTPTHRKAFVTTRSRAVWRRRGGQELGGGGGLAPGSGR